MQEFFFTLLIIWILFKIFGRGMIKHQSFTYTQNNYNNSTEDRKKEGEIKVDYIPNKKQKEIKEDGEYTDYEEIK